ncbi:MerR family transcriptional regulator [Natronoglycomyces albus]|uniref:MerR family transcriptional regulator n=1 Tax=Natronoglycomyces albus TaxID=2811108 RepID=A0A895XUQ6_9ACTN|nr:MerR family transcriptional regulator [Natronoglycomyces albus]
MGAQPSAESLLVASQRRLPNADPAEFNPEPLGPSAARAQLGWRGTSACRIVGITYRQLDYWARTKLVEPSITPASGSGSQRRYSFRDIVVLKLVKRLLDTGISLQNIRKAVAVLRSRGVDDLAQITLMSDGVGVYECRSADEIIDLLAGGQGVFAIAVASTVKEIMGSLSVPQVSVPKERSGIDVPDSGAEGCASPAV